MYTSRCTRDNDLVNQKEEQKALDHIEMLIH